MEEENIKLYENYLNCLNCENESARNINGLIIYLRIKNNNFDLQRNLLINEFENEILKFRNSKIGELYDKFGYFDSNTIGDALNSTILSSKVCASLNKVYDDYEIDLVSFVAKYSNEEAHLKSAINSYIVFNKIIDLERKQMQENITFLRQIIGNNYLINLSLQMSKITATSIFNVPRDSEKETYLKDQTNCLRMTDILYNKKMIDEDNYYYILETINRVFSYMCYGHKNVCAKDDNSKILKRV